MNKLFLWFAWLAVLLAGCQPAQPPAAASPETDEGAFTAQRLDMVHYQVEVRDVSDPAVLEAMRRVPRHLFVPEPYVAEAYADYPLPIGYGQSISQPYIVGLMSEQLQVQPGERVLEIGTGSGYQAAILAEMGAEVYTMEIVPELAEQAQDRLKRLGYGRIQVLNEDGYFGWEEHAPYQAIVVTAAPDHLPQPLVNQLAEGGRMVIPIGPQGFVQTLWLVEKKNGEVEMTNLGGATFVPFTRK